MLVSPSEKLVPHFNFKMFMQFLGKTFFSLFLAPVVAFVVSFAACFLGMTSATLVCVLWECLYVDVLFSILTFCVIIVFGSEYKVQVEIKDCFGKESKIYTVLRSACGFMLLLLIVLEIKYKASAGDPIRNNWVYNVSEIISFCTCIIAQCISHPKAYFCP